MKVLLTGATSAQVSVERGTETFAGLVHQALQDGGHHVEWVQPSISMSKDYLAEFDSVVVGIAPPTSTAAHRIYGALSVIQFAYELGNLRLLVDAPEPRRIFVGLKSIYSKPDSLTKDFYQKRREYRKTADEEVLERLHVAVRLLHTQEWPTTIFPLFPWMSFPSVSTEISMTNAGNLAGLNLDSHLLRHHHENVPVKSDYWVVDSPTTKWSSNIEKTVSHQVLSTKASRKDPSGTSYARMRGAIGCFVSVYRYGTPWWSVALSQALSSGVPVVTDWRLSSMLGPEWAVLAQSIEDMNEYERLSLAEAQRDSYIKAIPNWEDSVEKTCNSILRK